MAKPHGTTLTDRAVRLWPTPVARDDQKSPDAHMAMKARMGGNRTQATSLTVVAKMWPTPKASQGGADPESDKRGGVNLKAAVAAWPTPRARDMKGMGYEDSLPAVASGHQAPTTEPVGSKPGEPVCLNPPFVEWLMGWPIGWTDCTRSATASYRSWLRTHSSASPAAQASSWTT